MRALVPEAQTLLTVVQTVESVRPALMAHWRAGFWPRLETCYVSSLDGCGEEEMLGSSLSGEDISVENLLDIFGLYGWYSLKGSWSDRESAALDCPGAISSYI